MLEQCREPEVLWAELATGNDDRLGVRNSIVDRMRRHGGTAVVRSTPGEGTEVRLTLEQDTDKESAR